MISLSYVPGRSATVRQVLCSVSSGFDDGLHLIVDDLIDAVVPASDVVLAVMLRICFRKLTGQRCKSQITIEPFFFIVSKSVIDVVDEIIPDLLVIRYFYQQYCSFHIDTPSWLFL